MIKRYSVFGVVKTVLRSVSAQAFPCAVALAVAFFASAACNADDLVRYLVKTETGAYEERSVEGVIVAVSPDGIELEMKDQNALAENPIPSERVLWILLQGAPINLAAARVETEVGNYEEALEKLDDIKPEDADPQQYPLVAAEIDWYRAYASLQLALADAGTFSEGGTAMNEFCKEHPDSYRYYESRRLLGDALYAMSNLQTQSARRQRNLDNAREAYSTLERANSEIVRARGKLGLATVALAADELDDAETLFNEVAQHSEFDVEYAEATIGLARTTARQGRTEEATELLNELLSVTPNDSTLRRAKIYNALGDVLADANRPQEAVVAYLHIDLLYPAARTERVAALKALVGQWRKLGREDRARETIERLRERFNVDVR